MDTENFSPTLLQRHKDSLSELIRRDKNRPSIIMWSIANEPRTQLPDAENYFKEVARHTKTLDPSRPITIAIARGASVSVTLIDLLKLTIDIQCILSWLTFFLTRRIKLVNFWTLSVSTDITLGTIILDDWI